MGAEEDSTGNVRVEGGGNVNASSISIGIRGMGLFVVTGAGSIVSTASGVRIGTGNGGSGELTIADGGVVNVTAALDNEVVLGSDFFGGTGILNIGEGGLAGVLNASEVRGTDGVSLLIFNHTNADYVFTRNGTASGGEIDLTNGLALYHNGTGQTTLVGSNSYTEGTFLNAGTLVVSTDDNLGDSTSGLTFGGGTLRVRPAVPGAVTIDRAATLNAVATVEVTDAGTTVTWDGQMTGNGVLTKTGLGELVLTATNSYTGTVSPNEGTTVRAGTLTVDGGTISHADRDLAVAASLGDVASFAIRNGGTVTSRDAIVGGFAGSTGDAQISGGNWTVERDLYAGFGGNGTLDISGTANVNADGFIVANEATSMGLARISGGTVDVAASLNVGQGGDGMLEISGGMVTSRLGTLATFVDSESEVHVSGGRWTVTDVLSVGFRDEALLEISGTGEVTAGDVRLGVFASGNGTLNINGGRLTAGQVQKFDGGGTVTFNGETLRLSGDQANLFSGFSPGDVTLAAAGGTIDTQSFDVATAVDLGGTGGLTKAGAGTLILTGNNTFTGTTMVSAGKLLAGGPQALGLGDVIVGGTGTLGRGGAIGNTAVGGNLMFDTGSRLQVRYESPMVLDMFTVAGVTTIAPGSTFELLVPGPYTPPAAGQVITVIDSAGGVVGAFDNIVLPAVAATDFTVVSTADMVNLTSLIPFPPDPDNGGGLMILATPVPFTTFAQTFNEQQVANNLDVIRMGGNLSADQREVIGTLSMLPSGDALRSAYNQIAPESIGTISRMAFGYSNVSYLNLQRRGAELRRGQRGVSSAGLNLLNNDGRARAMGPLLAGTNYDSGTQFTDPAVEAKRMAVADKKMISVLDIDNKVFESTPDNKWGAFAIGAGQFGGVDGGNNLAGYDFDTGGVTLGMDYRLAANAAIGFALGYAGSEATVDGLGSTVSVDSARFGLYGTWYEEGFEFTDRGWYVDGYLGGAYNSYDSSREIAFGGISRTALSMPEGWQFDSSLNGGFDLPLGNGFTLAPYGGFQYTHVGIDGYQETNASSLNLAVNSTTAESLRSNVGLTLGWVGEATGITWHPQIRGAWQYEFLNGIQTVNSRFANGAGILFATQVANALPRNTAFVGASVTAEVTDTIDVSLSYDAEANRNYLVHSISGSVSAEF